MVLKIRKNEVADAIKVYVADKPMLWSHYSKFEKPVEDLALYSAFTGSVHEVTSRTRKTI